MHNWFDILQDKYQSPYFTNTEKDTFLNRAQIEYINSLLPDKEGQESNLEENSHLLENLSPLIFQLSTSLNMDASGFVLDSAIQTLLDTESSSTELFMKILNVYIEISGVEYPVKYVRHNDFYKFQTNDFKRASTSLPQYRRLSGKFAFSPIDISNNIYFTLLKYPREVSLSSTINSELPESTHNNIISIGIDLAGIASRDEALASLNQLHKNV